MESIPYYVKSLFFPPQPTEIDFKAAVEMVDRQRIARIAKTALFALATMATTATLVLTEAALIAWPFALTAIAVTLLAGSLFYRLNSLDRQYIAGLDDAKRSGLAKVELQRIFQYKSSLGNAEIETILKKINRLLGNTAFSKEQIEIVQFINAKAKDSNKSLAEIAEEQQISLNFSCQSEWVEKGYGLPAYTCGFTIMWDGKPQSEIEVAYQTTSSTES